MAVPVEPFSTPKPGPSGALGHYPGAMAGNPAPACPASSVRLLEWGKLRRIGLFGGSFDPVHVGHLHVAAAAARAAGLERVLFLPAAQPPHKPEQILASGSDRVAMLELALRDHADWFVDTIELERAGISYTIDTVRELRARFCLHPDARLFLVLGSDNLRGFSKWKDAAGLLQLIEPIVVPREVDLGSTLENLRAEFPPELAARIERAIVPCSPVLVASSAIRAALRRGHVAPGLLPAGVREYIEARGIYAAPPRGTPRA